MYQMTPWTWLGSWKVWAMITVAGLLVAAIVSLFEALMQHVARRPPR